MEGRLGRSLDPESLRPMLGVEVDYLRAAFDVIEAREGSLLNYIERELGVGEAERTRLRRQLQA
jgi:protein-tyrosine phosphatase